MKHFRLKKEATPFFKEKYATTIYDYEQWEKLGVDINALEEVENAFLTYGHSDKKNRSSSLSGWSIDEGSHFHFTITFPSVKMFEHDKFSNGKVIRSLMNKIQNNINHFYSDFIDNNLD
ncbi:hypothetical protein [Elizabethkingia anophelis]|uniref:hypothetical protein n=1 Tax=Elizabethkingia anophelis TaxID=1117645 RepID=UPI00054F708B|nr:hypothetical protein [Elizabethkingia anophelis]